MLKMFRSKKKVEKKYPPILFVQMGDNGDGTKSFDASDSELDLATAGHEVEVGVYVFQAPGTILAPVMVNSAAFNSEAKAPAMPKKKK